MRMFMASGFSALAASRVDGATSRTVEAMFVFRRSPSSAATNAALSALRFR